MRYYEIILMAKASGESQFKVIVDRYKDIIAESGGKVHHFEDWGKRNLAYPIQKSSKANYVMMNVEATPESIIKIKSLADKNEVVLRYLVLVTKELNTKLSPIMSGKDKKPATSSDKKPETEKKES